MYDKVTGKLYITNHIVPGNVLDDKAHTYNDIRGGMKRIEDFHDAYGNPYTMNTFFGGNCKSLGFIKDYGFYACIRHVLENTAGNNREIIGFYIADGKEVTEAGRELLKKRFPSAEILWDEKPPKTPTEDDVNRRKALLKEAMELGHAPESIPTKNVEEIAGLVKAWKTGKREGAEGSVPVAESAVMRPYLAPDEEVIVTRKPNLSGAKRRTELS